VIKDVDHAEKAEASHAKVRASPKCDENSPVVTLPKAVDKAIHAHEKAIKKEHKMAGKLAKAERAHDTAVYTVQDNDKAITVRSDADRCNLSRLTVATD
jgi:hypothetical protein